MNAPQNPPVELEAQAIGAAMEDLTERLEAWAKVHGLALLVTICHPQTCAPLAFSQVGIPQDPLAVSRILNRACDQYLIQAQRIARESAPPPPPKLFGTN